MARVGVNIMIKIKHTFGLWGVANGIKADLRGHGHVWVRGADIGFIARVGPMWCMA